jgi:hypothetical protein
MPAGQGMQLLRRLGYGVWLGLLLQLLIRALIPARIRHLRVRHHRAPGISSVSLSWDYSWGTRPLSLIFDLEAGAAAGSVTSDGSRTEALIPLVCPLQGPYQVTISATYRLLGYAYTRTHRVSGFSSGV